MKAITQFIVLVIDEKRYVIQTEYTAKSGKNHSNGHLTINGKPMQELIYPSGGSILKEFGIYEQMLTPKQKEILDVHLTKKEYLKSLWDGRISASSYW